MFVSLTMWKIFLGHFNDRSTVGLGEEIILWVDRLTELEWSLPARGGLDEKGPIPTVSFTVSRNMKVPMSECVEKCL